MKENRTIRKILRYFGYELKKRNDAFFVQQELIKVKEPIIFDVGANHGLVTKKYRKKFPLASIYCFEPYPESFELLNNNFERDNRITCYKVALAESRGKASLSANVSSDTNSLLATDKAGLAYWGGGKLETTSHVVVETTSIDCFVYENGLSHIDILKLDVQGAEFAVLKGSKEVLSKQKISLLYTELILCPTYLQQHKLHEFLSFLDSVGYQFLDFFNPVRRGYQLLQIDAIFLSSAIEKTRQVRFL